MVISELVIGSLRREVAKEGLAHIRANQSKIFNSVPGNLSTHVAHVTKFNGQDVSSEYKPILGLEWNDVSDFHNFYPASEAFRAFAGVFGPYAAGKPQPQLFKPTPGSMSFSELFSQGNARMLIAPSASEKRDELSGAWEKLVESFDEGALMGQWSGWGIEDAEGSWAGIVAWKDDHELDLAASETLQKLKVLNGLDEYVVSFRTGA